MQQMNVKDAKCMVISKYNFRKKKQVKLVLKIDAKQLIAKVYLE